MNKGRFDGNVAPGTCALFRTLSLSAHGAGFWILRHLEVAGAEAASCSRSVGGRRPARARGPFKGCTSRAAI